MAKKLRFNPWEGIKVGNIEIFLTTICIWYISNIFFYMNLLALKFGAHVINIEMMSFQNFHGQKTIFQPSRGCQISFPGNAKTPF